MFEMLVVYTITVFGFCWGIGGSPLTLGARSYWAYLAGVQVASGVPVTSPLGPATQRVLRFFLHLVECPACLGFWVALIVAFAIPDLAGELPLVPGGALLRAISLAFYTAGANFLLGRATGLIDKP